jgi:hypothetical protein
MDASPAAGDALPKRSGNDVEMAEVAVVAIVASRTEAELIVGMLRSHGLRADLAADDAGGQYPQLQLEGVRVVVASSDEASARRLIAEANDTAEPDTAEPDGGD